MCFLRAAGCAANPHSPTAGSVTGEPDVPLA